MTNIIKRVSLSALALLVGGPVLQRGNPFCHESRLLFRLRSRRSPSIEERRHRHRGRCQRSHQLHREFCYAAENRSGHTRMGVDRFCHHRFGSYRRHCFFCHQVLAYCRTYFQRHFQGSPIAGRGSALGSLHRLGLSHLEMRFRRGSGDLAVRLVIHPRILKE